ncbi:unnamed protein product [Moneuplotes crassus]|uniref:Uncharacterized protein n=1 Tax=Euplotes crassus TaxID=5936 RepID=A0AAD1UCB2_EUPCR|nr:unnamed protein product [Moneuplotes crassus]
MDLKELSQLNADMKLCCFPPLRISSCGTILGILRSLSIALLKHVIPKCSFKTINHGSRTKHGYSHHEIMKVEYHEVFIFAYVANFNCIQFSKTGIKICRSSTIKFRRKAHKANIKIKRLVQRVIFAVNVLAICIMRAQVMEIDINVLYTCWICPENFNLATFCI